MSAVARFLAAAWPAVLLAGVALALLASVLFAVDRAGALVAGAWRAARRRRAQRRAVAALLRDPARRSAVDAAFAAAGAALRGARAWPYAARSGRDGVTILLGGDPGPPPEPFRAAGGPRRWLLPATEDVPAPPQPPPLVLLGGHDGGALLLDVSRAPGPIVVGGAERAAKPVADLIARQLPAGGPPVRTEPESGPQWTITAVSAGRVDCIALGVHDLDPRPAFALRPPAGPAPSAEPAAGPPQEQQAPAAVPLEPSTVPGADASVDAHAVTGYIPVAPSDVEAVSSDPEPEGTTASR